jgi:lipopolysaccharide export system protein LptA
MHRGLLLILGLALTPAPVALAQLGPSDPGAPISIQADSGLEWQQNQQLYIARGNAFASRGPATVKANTLIAHYREAKGGAPNPNTSVAGAGGSSEIYRVEADGNVVITRDTRTIVGDHADYDMDQGIGIVRGKNLKMTTAVDVVTAKDAFEWYDQKQIAIARGDAVATRQNNRTIKADTLTSYMVKVALRASRRRLLRRRQNRSRSRLKAHRPRTAMRRPPIVKNRRSAGSTRRVMSSSSTDRISGAAITASTTRLATSVHYSAMSRSPAAPMSSPGSMPSWT